MRISDLSERARSYGIPGVCVDGFDVLAVYQAAVEAVARARRGDGPTLLVTECYRIEGHYAGEPEVYRTREEVSQQRKNDPIPRFHNQLLDEGVATHTQLDEIEEVIRQEMVEAVAFAKASPMPDPSTAMDYIYA
jgi:pyruvate dehydrogenase E1 component alpha subunit